MNDDNDASSLTTTSSFHSAISDDDYAEVGSIFPFKTTRDEINSFCLDINKLEQVASKTNGGLPCRIYRTTEFAQKTYFLLRADFSGGSSWNVIIPHPHSFTREEVLSRRQGSRPPLQYRNPFNTSNKVYVPKIISWEMSSFNAAGVPYLFVESISDCKGWESKDWIQFARENDTKDKRRITEKRCSSHATLPSTSSSSISSVLSYTNSSRRTTQETDRTEVSMIIAKPGKSVRFQVDDISHDVAKETIIQESADKRIKLKRLVHYLKVIGRKIERRVIGLLMRWGY